MSAIFEPSVNTSRKTTRREFSAVLAAVVTALAIPGLANASSERCVPQNAPVTGSIDLDGCEREVRIAYLAGAYEKPGTIIAALTNRTADIVIEGMNPIKVRVGSLNNSGIALEDSAEAYRRTLVIGGLQLNYIAVPVGQRASVNVGIHRLNTDGSRRDDAESNPPYKIAETCVVQGGPELHTLAGLNTIQIFAQDSKLGDGPGDYKNLNRDLAFQDPKMLFQGVELGYLLKK